jgi:hypothetical protein
MAISEGFVDGEMFFLFCRLLRIGIVAIACCSWREGSLISIFFKSSVVKLELQEPTPSKEIKAFKL